MLDAKLEPTVAEEEAVGALASNEEPIEAEAEKTDEELADEVVVEISVDGMCGVY
jgi:mycofactocin precursor